MSIRLLLIGDIHLREGEHLDDVERCLDFANTVADEREVDAVLIAGDQFEGKSTPEERSVLGCALGILTQGHNGEERPVIMLKGNHDQARELDVFAGYAGVEVFDKPGIAQVYTLGLAHEPLGVDVLCVPWPERSYLAAQGLAGETSDQAGSAALAAMLRGMVATRECPERPLVVLAHLQVLGAQSNSAQPLIGKAIEAVLGDLQDLGAAFIALGHVHKPQELAPGVEYIGSLTVHDHGEEDEEKRIGVLTIEGDGTASVEWIPTPCRRWVTIEARVEKKPPSGGDQPMVFEDGGPLYADSNLRYRYTCDETEQHLFDHAAIEQRFAAAHALKIVPQVARAERVRAADVAAARTVEEKLHAWGGATDTEITKSHVEKLHQLESEAV